MVLSLKIDVVTIFPGILNSFLDESILKRAVQSGAVVFRTVNLRDFTTDRHKTTDDRPYGGGPGMVMTPEPLFKAVESLVSPVARVILMTPQGRKLEQSIVRELAEESHLVFVCGRYEGVDERVRQELVTDEISIGDYVLTNGILPAAVVIDSVVRLRPGVLGAEDSTVEESFSDGRLEYPQYTRPADFRGMKVPDILLSGNHGEIEHWRREQSTERTLQRRPDMMEREKILTELTGQKKKRATRRE
ncbi:MAG: tRNA (guanosine(37)-N1)-methyltransferase TrmD [Kiritimatiellae bacterium]|nr:tRNA (guanosine(37)-N1)-methyltransferase TrmD [Kiritimatiellia bacterium]